MFVQFFNKIGFCFVHVLNSNAVYTVNETIENILKQLKLVKSLLIAHLMCILYNLIYTKYDPIVINWVILNIKFVL